jgi:hypothetical protein
VSILIDGQVAVGHLDYGAGTGERPIAVGSHTLQVQAQTPGAPTTVIGPTEVSFGANTDTVIAAEGAVANLAARTFVHDLAVIPPTGTQVQVLHAAPNAPAVSVYVTAPGASLSGATPLGTFAFEGSLGPAQVAAGPAQIRVTPAGASSPVLFDSGTITLAGGADLVISALQNEGPGTAPIVLSVVDAQGNNSQIVDVGTPAELRAVHVSPDAPAVSILDNDDAAAPLVPTLAYAAFTPYVALTPGSVSVEATPAANTADILAQLPLRLDAGSIHSLYALGDLASLQLLPTRDDDRRYATQARLRIIHGSPSAGPVDIYLTAPGGSIASAAPTYATLPFGGDTGFVSYAAGSYVLTVTPAGSKSPAIGPLTVQLANKGIYTAVARDAPGGGGPFGLIQLDDFATPP